MAALPGVRVAGVGEVTAADAPHVRATPDGYDVRVRHPLGGYELVTTTPDKDAATRMAATLADVLAAWSHVALGGDE